MGAQAAFILGVLTGCVIYWLIYRIFWRRWRAYLERDMTYLQGKIKSAEYTNFGLERQMTALKGSLAELRTKINDLERDKRLALARVEEVSGEKQALINHMDALRAELSAYKKAAAQPEQPAPAAPQHSNGKSHETVQSTRVLEKVSLPTNGKGEGKNGNGAASLPLASAPKPTSPGTAPSAHTNGRAKPYLTPIEPPPEPVLLIARPRMDGDRLEIIQGIGPVIIRKLRLAGIVTFQALALLTPEKLREIVGPRTAKLMDAESVIAQAKKLAEGRKG